MIRFNDGPASGIQLMVKRAPIYLRLVFARKEWDALDQVDDEPKRTEQITAYRRVALEHPTHFKFFRRSANGWYANATYAVVTPQPDDATMRDKAKWQAWCVAQEKLDKAAEVKS